jgi:hypothetical protein
MTERRSAAKKSFKNDRRIAGLLFVALAGCSLSKSRQGESSSGPGEPTNLTTIRTNDSEFVGGSGLALNHYGALPPGGVRYDLGIDGRNSAGDGWSVRAYLDAEAVETGRASVKLATEPGGLGVVSLTRQTVDGDAQVALITASAGTLTFEFEKGQITGQVTAAVPDSLNATFEGVLGVVCYVPGSGVTDGGSVMSEEGGPAPVLTLDETLENPACEIVRPWAPAQ